jgi:hypothetical protein
MGPARGRSQAYPTAAALFFEFLNFFVWNAEVLLGIWGEWVHSTPIFQASPYTWKCQIFHSS